MTKINYQILYDNSKPLCLVGNTQWNHEILNMLKSQLKISLITFEEYCDKSNEWKKDHQYFVAGVDTQFRKTIIEKIFSDNNDSNFVSIISPNAVIQEDTEIGKGVFIQTFCSITGPCTIGDFSLIAHYTDLTHNKSVIGKYCFIGPRSSLINSNLGDFNWLGWGCRFLNVSTINKCQFLMNSRLSNIKITEEGTFKNNKKISNGTCLDAPIKN